MREQDARLLAIGLGLGRKPRPVYKIGSKLVFVLGILVGFFLARIMTLIVS